MSSRPMSDLSILLDNVYIPILNNVLNMENLPQVIKKDIDSKIQDLRNVIAEVGIFEIKSTFAECGEFCTTR